MTEDLASVWFRASTEFNRSVFEAQRATLAAFGLIDNSERAATTESPDTPSATDDSAETPDGPSKETAADWECERTVTSVADLAVGDRVSFTKRLSDADIDRFATASGDTNRLHLDDEFAEETRFGGRIVHGTLVAGLISAALARLPGLTIYLSQDARFLRPVTPGTRLTAVVEVVELLGDGRYRLSTLVHDENDETVIEGEAVVLIDDLPAGEEAVVDSVPSRS